MNQVYEDEEDGKGEICGRGWVAERAPTEEEYDHPYPEDGAETPKNVPEELPDILGFNPSYGIVPVPLNIASSRDVIETTFRRGSHHVVKLFDRDIVESQLLKKVDHIVFELSRRLGFVMFEFPGMLRL